MIELLNDIYGATVIAGTLIAKPIMVGFLVIYCYQMIKFFHYVSNRPFPARIGFGSLVIASFTELIMHSFFDSELVWRNLTDAFYIVSAVTASFSSLTVYEKIKVEILHFYDKMKLNLHVAQLILGVVAISYLVKVYADKELAERRATTTAIELKANTDAEVVKQLKEKNQLLVQDTAYKGKIDRKIDKIAGSVSKLTKRSDTASKERKLQTKLAKRIIKGQEYANRKTIPVNKLGIKGIKTNGDVTNNFN